MGVFHFLNCTDATKTRNASHIKKSQNRGNLLTLESLAIQYATPFLIRGQSNGREAKACSVTKSVSVFNIRIY